MTKYHVAKDGFPAPCNARVMGCPLGGNEVHGEFNSPQDAQAWAEKILESQYGGSFGVELGIKNSLAKINNTPPVVPKAGNYVVVPIEDLDPETQLDFSSEASKGGGAALHPIDTYTDDFGEVTITPIVLPSPSPESYLGDIAIPKDKLGRYVDNPEKYETEFSVKPGENFKTYEKENGDSGFVIGGKSYSITNGDRLPKDDWSNSSNYWRLEEASEWASTGLSNHEAVSAWNDGYKAIELNRVLPLVDGDFDKALDYIDANYR